eukprot:7387425-Prymnesium_polylepis.2
MLMLPSLKPDAILVPSGEKADEGTWLLPICSPTRVNVVASAPHTTAHTEASAASQTNKSTRTRECCASEGHPPQSLTPNELDTIIFPLGEKPTEYTYVAWALVCSATNASVDASATRNRTPGKLCCAKSHFFAAKSTDQRSTSEGRLPHSLMMPFDTEPEPDTILVPSGEKPTQSTLSLWALVCSSTIANVNASTQHTRASR